MIIKISIIIAFLVLITIVLWNVIEYIKIRKENKIRHYKCLTCNQDIYIKSDSDIKKCNFIITCPNCLRQFLASDSLVKKTKKRRSKKFKK